jgi:hypothetical protein
MLKNKENTPYDRLKEEFVQSVHQAFGKLQTEISERNQKIASRDNYIYGDALERSLDIPIGHDHTPVNWLRRTVEIHKNMFMSRGFQVVSTYDNQDPEANGDAEEQGMVALENKKQKDYAEARMQMVKSIMADNGGDAFWAILAENASAIGDSAVKMYYDEKEDKVELCQIESIENLYALWSKDDFRQVDAYGYIFQVSKQEAVSEYGAPDDVQTSPLGRPLGSLSSPNYANSAVNSQSSQPMVTVMEVTGKIQGWAVDKDRIKKVKIGDETELNCLIVGTELTRIIGDSKKLPKYYILPNKRQRRRPWGLADVSEAAININLTYVETLSDWRTVSSKVNFPKYKFFGVGADAQLPKPESRKVQYVPLADGQDVQLLGEADSNGLDWGRQLEELKEQFVRETGLSRVLFDDPSVTLNSNQALLTSMKPTSDIAEAKKQLWTPVLTRIFTDALELTALNNPEIKDAVNPDDNWALKIMWPSIMQKEDPLYQNMLLNRFNAGTMSLQSYVEAQGESKEEIDRLRTELVDPITAAILGKQTPLLAQTFINAATAQLQAWYAATQPQPPQQGGGANTPGVNPNGGVAATGASLGTAEAGAGLSPMSQPGSGASATSAQGALDQVTQTMGG